MGLLLGYTSIFSQKQLEFNSILDRGQKIPEDYSDYPLLDTWARFQGWTLLPDHPYGGMEDSVCRMIPDTGLKIQLKLIIDPGHTKVQTNPDEVMEHLYGYNIQHPVYVVLDVTKYQAINHNQRIVPRSLKIYVNSIYRKTITTISSRETADLDPIVITIAPEEAKTGSVIVDLIPAGETGGRFWGIWDASITQTKPVF